MIQGPCHHCPDRKVGCHSECHRYKVYQEQIDDLKKKKRVENDFKEYMMDQRERMRKLNDSKTYASFMKRRGE